MRLISGVLIVFAVQLALSAAPASAVLINFTAAGDAETVEMSNGLDADFTLDALTDSVDLVPGVTQTVFINGGSLDIFQGANANGSGTLTQNLTINSPSATPSVRSISQSASAFTTAGSPPFTPASADLFLGAGSAVTFDLGGAYELTVTPLAAQRTGQTSTTIPFSNNADFLLTVVPEPTGAMAAVAAASIAAMRRRRR